MGTESATARQLVVAKVGDVLCGIDIDAVHEIIPTQEITSMPRSPRNMLGVTNVRGSVIPVVDLRACLGYIPTEFANDTRIVLVSYDDSKIGLVVDAVAEVITLEEDVFQKIGVNIGNSGYLRAVARLDDRLILNIDHARVVEEGLDKEPSEITSLLKEIEAQATTEASETEPPTNETPTEDENENVKEDPVDNASDEATTPDAEATEETADEGGLNVELLESSFALLAPQGEELVDQFYTRLFETAPAVRSLFPEDLAGQKKALLGALGALIANLRAPEKLTGFLEDLGERHVGYGALEPHYDVVAEVLITTMADLAGDVWNDELQKAWTDALVAVKGIMLAGAQKIEAAA